MDLDDLSNDLGFLLLVGAPTRAASPRHRSLVLAEHRCCGVFPQRLRMATQSTPARLVG
jgi:hypothetical protein